MGTYNSPVLVFGYNRPIHLEKTLSSLSKNQGIKESVLYYFCDGPKNDADIKPVNETIEVFNKFEIGKKVYKNYRKTNNGLASSIINSVSEIIQDYGSAIIIEDDLLLASSFLTYMNMLLEKYKHNEDIFSVSGYSHSNDIFKVPNSYKYDLFIHPRASSWGWGTWKNRWLKADWQIRDFNKFINNKTIQKEFNKGGEDLSKVLIKQKTGQRDSWAVRWTYAHFKHNAYCIYPIKSLINNIGHDGTGKHCPDLKNNPFAKNKLNFWLPKNIPENFYCDKNIIKAYNKFYSQSFKNKIFKYLKYRK